MKVHYSLNYDYRTRKYNSIATYVPRRDIAYDRALSEACHIGDEYIPATGNRIMLKRINSIKNNFLQFEDNKQ